MNKRKNNWEDKMKKKILSIILSTLMVTALLAGCGAENTTASQQEEPAKAETETAKTEEAVAPAETEEAITITYANFNASGGNEATLDAMYQAFHEKYRTEN